MSNRPDSPHNSGTYVQPNTLDDQTLPPGEAFYGDDATDALHAMELMGDRVDQIFANAAAERMQAELSRKSKLATFAAKLFHKL